MATERALNERSIENVIGGQTVTVKTIQTRHKLAFIGIENYTDGDITVSYEESADGQTWTGVSGDVGATMTIIPHVLNSQGVRWQQEYLRVRVQATESGTIGIEDTKSIEAFDSHPTVV